MTQTLSKSELLAQIERERAIWQHLVAAIGETPMRESAATDGWTFKDVVAHLNGWRFKTLARLDAAQQGREPTAPPWPADLNDDTDAGTDAINAWIYQDGRDQSLQQVLDTHSQSFDRMRDAVTNLSERELSEIGRYPWLEGYALGAVITSTFEHFHEDHEAALQAWLDQSKQS